MTSREVYAEFRRHLGPWFKTQGFRRAAQTPLGWQNGSLMVWFQCDPHGWDPYGGSRVYVNFQSGPSEKSWGGNVRRLNEFLPANDFAKVQELQNRVVPKLKLPPREYVARLRAGFTGPDADAIIETYLDQFKPDHSTLRPNHDFALRYWDAEDIAVWSSFLLERLPALVEKARQSA